MTGEEVALEPDRPIIDPHLHFWEIQPPQEPQRFLFPEALEMIEGSGHRITHSVFVECNAMYRADGPAELRSLGETEFANGIAAISASGNYGPCRLGHRIVGMADLTLGSRVRSVLEAHVAIAGERFRGIRMNTVWAESGLFGFPCEPGARGRIASAEFRAGAAVLSEMGLSLDIWCVHTQLGEVMALADSLPELTIVVDHVGTPEVLGIWAGRERETFADWSARIGELARRPNVVVKVGGMGMDITGPLRALPGPASSEELARLWGARAQVCIEAFGAQRAMFESNFPPDKSAATYGATWNAFKRIAAGCSEDEKDALFRRTAARIYKIDVED